MGSEHQAGLGTQKEGGTSAFVSLCCGSRLTFDANVGGGRLMSSGWKFSPELKKIIGFQEALGLALTFRPG